MKTNWRQNGETFFLEEVSAYSKKLPIGIFNMEDHPLMGLHLKIVNKGFNLPPKIYDTEEEFISKVCKTWDNITGNIGIILDGEKGSGKTITAKQICQRLNLPVILVNSDFEGKFSNYCKNINQDVVYFFDEYEKNFNNSHHMLSFMDGANNSNYRKMFILTMNNSYSINDALINRPSRIRYYRKFGNISNNAIIEIINDKLKHNHLREQTIDYIGKIRITTIDIVISLIEEINIHEQMPKDMNVLQNSYKILYELIERGDKVERIFVDKTRNKNTKIDETDINSHFYFNDNHIGIIMDYDSITKEFLVNNKENDVPCELSMRGSVTKSNIKQKPNKNIKKYLIVDEDSYNSIYKLLA